MDTPDRPKKLGFDDVCLIDQNLVFDQFFKVNELKISHRRFDGGDTGEMLRLVFERGDAAVVLPYDPITDEVVLVEQFRVGAYAAIQREKGNRSPWLLECIAGMIDDLEAPERTAVREAKEEADIELSHLTSMLNYYSSPGGTSERIYLYAAIVDSTTAGGFHGVADEHEDIRVCRLKFADAVGYLERGVIDNASTVIAIQWLQLNRSRWLDSLGIATSKVPNE